MRDYERKAVADAAYEAWRAGRNYDAAWDCAEAAVDRAEPYDYYDAKEAADRGAMWKPVRMDDRDHPEEGT